MNKSAHVVWLILMATLLMSCQFPGAMIRPGDSMGGMEFINEWENCQAPNLNEICTFDALFDGTCEIPASVTRFWVSSGWMEGSQASLDLAWKDSEWRMTFDDHEVDLDAFGTYDLDWQLRQNRLWDVAEKTSKDIRHGQEKARMWNVCIVNPAPGTHKVVYEFLMKNGIWRGNHVETFVFTILAADSQ